MRPEEAAGRYSIPKAQPHRRGRIPLPVHCIQIFRPWQGTPGEFASPAIDSYADTNIKRIDIYANPNIEKVVNIYKTHCGNLVPINKYYRSNIELKKMIGSYLEQTESNLEYFTRVCDIANRVKKIGDVNVDIKTILRNHESFYNGKYKIVNDDGLF